MLRRTQDWRCHHVRVSFHFRTSVALIYSSLPPRRVRVLHFSAANPAFSAEELQNQLEVTKARLLFVHPTALQAGLAAAKAVGLSKDRIVLIEPTSSRKQPLATLDEVILEGLQRPERFVERQLKPGEGKTKIAVSTAPPAPVRAIDGSLVVLQLVVWNDGET